MKHKIGKFTILGTDQDFPKPSSEPLSVAYNEKLERKRWHGRKTKYKTEINPIRNRFDRMKSYCLSRKIDWRVDWRDYERLWETAPEVFSKEKGRMVPAKEHCDRKSAVRACRKNQTDDYVALDNLVLKHGSVIIHGPLSP